MTKMQQSYNKTYSTINKIYWKAEDKLHEFSLWFMPVFMIVFIFLGVAQTDYILHKRDRDFSVLSATQQNRKAELFDKIAKLYGKESSLRDSFNYAEMREIRAKREILSKELGSLLKLAPYSSWSYKFYVAIHAITPHKDL